ncbi:MAG TPA: hypothetical protein VI861_03805 [Rickettsiales bacterium]|nr:hypothetical protein [Rickettsiales bacterium]
MMKFLKMIATGLSSIFKAIKKISAPFVGIPIALALSVVFFTGYVIASSANLSFAHLRKKRGFGAEELFYNPTWKSISDALLGLTVGVWTKYGVSFYTDELKQFFEKTEKFFERIGMESSSELTGGIDNENSRGSKVIASKAYSTLLEDNNKPKSTNNSLRQPSAESLKPPPRNMLKSSHHQ